MISDPGAGAGPAVGTVEPFEVRIGDDEIADLRRRLADTRWPDAETVEGWAQGVPLAYVRELCAYWADGYDFGLADRVNAFPRSACPWTGSASTPCTSARPSPAPCPLVLTHGWPGSVVEFLEGRWARWPTRGPTAATPPTPSTSWRPRCPATGGATSRPRPGWGVDRIARAWDTLMGGLGYDRYGAQGGDWGATVTGSLAQQVPDRLVGIHVNMATVGPDKSTLDDLSADEQRTLDDIAEHRATGTGYSTQQSTRPQTLGYGLADSPAGQCAWIVEKFWAWTDHDGDPASALTRDQMLDDVSVYWFTNTATSSARLYWESLRDRNTDPIAVPSGISIFPARSTGRPAAGPSGATPTCAGTRRSTAAGTSRPTSSPRRSWTRCAGSSASCADPLACPGRLDGHAVPMRFSVWLSINQPWAEVLATARHAEATGWDGVWVADHFMGNVDAIPADVPTLEAGSVVAALAAAVRPGAHRHPRLRQHLPAPGGRWPTWPPRSTT